MLSLTDKNKNYARNRNAEFFKSLFLHILSLFKVFFFLLDLLNIFKILHKITRYVLHLCGAERGKTEGEHFEMRFYTSSAGRLGMLVFVRVKKAIFSLKTRPRGEPGEVWSIVEMWNKHQDRCLTWRSGLRGPLCGSGPWSCGRPWQPPSASFPPASPAAAPRESEGKVFKCDPILTRPPQPPPLLSPLTCFSARLRRSRNRSSSRTQAGSSLWPCCLAFSNWLFSSRSTCSSWSNRACRVRDTCRSSSRSKEVRKRLSRPLTGTGG